MLGQSNQEGAPGWFTGLLITAAGGLLTATVTLAKMIKTNDTKRIESLETQLAEREAKHEKRLLAVEERAERCEADRASLHTQLAELNARVGVCEQNQRVKNGN